MTQLAYLGAGARAAFVLCLSALWACAGASPEPVEAEELDAPVDAQTEPGDEPEPAPAAEEQEQTPRESTWSPIVLWCDDSKGEACQSAALELDVAPSATEAVPKAMFSTIQDLPDDCSDPQISSLTHRLSDVLGISLNRWHDHVGSSMERSGLSSIYSAAGCVNCCNSQLPTVKIHAVPGSIEPMYLVRIWEAERP
jgi:hypothetical protein